MSNAKPNTCTHLLVHCIDFRIQPALSQWLRDTDMLGDTDVMAVAGASKNADDVAATVALAQKLHDIKQVWLTQHEDCGAYGGKTAFDSDEREQMQLVGDMDALRQRIQRENPNLTVHMVLVAQDGDTWTLKKIQPESGLLRSPADFCMIPLKKSSDTVD